MNARELHNVPTLSQTGIGDFRGQAAQPAGRCAAVQEEPAQGTSLGTERGVPVCGTVVGMSLLVNYLIHHEPYFRIVFQSYFALHTLSIGHYSSKELPN